MPKETQNLEANKNENLENLSVILAALKEDHLGRKEFDDRTKEVLTVVVALRKHIEQEVESAVKAFKSAQDTQAQRLSQALAELEKRVDRLFVEEKLSEISSANNSEIGTLRDEITSVVSELLTTAKTTLSTVKNGKDGRDGRDGADGKSVSIEDVKKVVAELLGGAVNEIKGQMPSRSLGASVVHKFIDDETPSGVINSSNTTFSLAKTPINGSLKLFLGGARQRVGQDFTLSGKTITFTIAPDTGSVLLADYRYF